MGYHPFPIPAATASRAYKNIYGSTINGCVYCGFCSSHACEMGAKGNVQSAVLPVLMGDKNFELRTHARVMKVNLDSSGQARGQRHVRGRAGTRSRAAG